MPIVGRPQVFIEENVNTAPNSHGVYGLYDSRGNVTYYGRAAGDGVTIRSRLRSHLRGDDGPCTQMAIYFNYEVTPFPYLREEELLTEYALTHNGRLPVCNDRRP